MKCQVDHVNRRKPPYQIDIYTLDDLKKLIEDENDAIIIDTDCLDDGIDFHIVVYDDYIE